ncbi:MAG: HAD family phosphatase [Planctomycetes bacterium]|nr:HAD family phosphatase [Planctomycetota bacterium]
MKKRRCRMLAVDLDGTVLTSHGELTPRTRRALARCRARGVEVVLCTARPPRSATPHWRRMKLTTPLIAYDGAMVVEPSTGEVLLNRTMPGILARKVLQEARRVHPEMVITFEIQDKWWTDELGASIITRTAKEGFKPDVVCDLDACVTRPVTKILISRSVETLDALERRLRRKLGKRLSVVRVEDYLLEMAAAGVSKAAGLKLVARRYGIKPSEVVAIGDGMNDIAMLKWAALGIAMGHAPDAVKRAADVVTASNDEEGVAKAIQTYVLRGT